MSNREFGSGSGSSIFEQKRREQLSKDPQAKPDLQGNPRWVQLLPNLDRIADLQVVLRLNSQAEVDAVVEGVKLATHIEETYSFFARSGGTVSKKIKQVIGQKLSLTLVQLANQIKALPPVEKAASTLEAEQEDPAVAHLDDYRAEDEQKGNPILDDPELFKSAFMALVNKENSGGPNQAESEYALALAFKQSLLQTLAQQERVDLAENRLNLFISSHEANKVVKSVTDLSIIRKKKQMRAENDGDKVSHD